MNETNLQQLCDALYIALWVFIGIFVIYQMYLDVFRTLNFLFFLFQEPVVFTCLVLYFLKNEYDYRKRDTRMVVEETPEEKVRRFKRMIRIERKRTLMEKRKNLKLSAVLHHIQGGLCPNCLAVMEEYLNDESVKTDIMSVPIRQSISRVRDLQSK